MVDFRTFFYSFGNHIEKRLAKALVLSLACLSAGAAQAADGKSYPGSICNRWTGQAANEDFAGDNALGISQFGFIVNKSSTKRLRVICPLAREHHGANFKYVTAQGTFDQCLNGACTSPSGCRFHVVNVSGDSVASGHFLLNPAQPVPNSAQQNFPSGGTAHRVDFPSDLSQGSTYTLVCALQPGHRLTRIELVEDAAQ